MTVARALDDAAIVRLAEKMLSVGPMLREATGPEVAAALGWPVIPDGFDWSMRLDPGDGLDGPGAFLPLEDGRPRALSVPILAPWKEGDEGNREQLEQDVFATATAALTRVFGPPTDRLPGEEPEVWWRRGPVVLRLVIGRFDVALQLELVDDVERDDRE